MKYLRIGSKAKRSAQFGVLFAYLNLLISSISITSILGVGPYSIPYALAMSAILTALVLKLATPEPKAYAMLLMPNMLSLLILHALAW